MPLEWLQVYNVDSPKPIIWSTYIPPPLPPPTSLPAIRLSVVSSPPVFSASQRDYRYCSLLQYPCVEKVTVRQDPQLPMTRPSPIPILTTTTHKGHHRLPSLAVGLAVSLRVPSIEKRILREDDPRGKVLGREVFAGPAYQLAPFKCWIYPLYQLSPSRTPLCAFHRLSSAYHPPLNLVQTASNRSWPDSDWPDIPLQPRICQLAGCPDLVVSVYPS